MTAGASNSVSQQANAPDAVNLLWVDKYKPRTTSEIIGNQSSVQQLTHFLKSWLVSLCDSAALLYNIMCYFVVHWFIGWLCVAHGTHGLNAPSANRVIGTTQAQQISGGKTTNRQCIRKVRKVRKVRKGSSCRADIWPSWHWKNNGRHCYCSHQWLWSDRNECQRHSK